MHTGRCGHRPLQMSLLQCTFVGADAYIRPP
nr:MAG TPA: hypothetical protein [Caudoviricetes sp.]